MKLPRSKLLWECLPVYSGVLVFSLLLVLKPDYAKRLITMPGGSWVGPVLLSMAGILMVVAGLPLYACRTLWEKNPEGLTVRTGATVVFVVLALVKSGVGWLIILLGPAAIAMIQS